MSPRDVVTAFLRRGGRVLLQKRSSAVRSYRGLWAAVSGSVEPGEEPRRTAERELEEETALGAGGILVQAGLPFIVEAASAGRRYRVHPFLFDSPAGEPRLCWESTEQRWEHPPEI